MITKKKKHEMKQFFTNSDQNTKEKCSFRVKFRNKFYEENKNFAQKMREEKINIYTRNII